jgi:hypothetical protein
MFAEKQKMERLFSLQVGTGELGNWLFNSFSAEPQRTKRIYFSNQSNKAAIIDLSLFEAQRNNLKIVFKTFRIFFL